jgi:hypothetical protein
MLVAVHNTRYAQYARRMVDDSYVDSKCPYHRALYWLVSLWVELLAILVLMALLLLLLV